MYFRKYGEEQFFTSSATMKKCLSKYLNVQPHLPDNKERVMNTFDLSNSQLEPFNDINMIQETLQVIVNNSQFSGVLDSQEYSGGVIENMHGGESYFQLPL